MNLIYAQKGGDGVGMAGSIKSRDCLSKYTSPAFRAINTSVTCNDDVLDIRGCLLAQI